MNVTLSGRTLYKDGKWNTLYLPFDVTLSGSPLNSAEAHTVKSASVTDKKLNLKFGDEVTTLKAGTPYIIKWTSGSNLTESDLVFNGVTINSTEPSASGTSPIRFMGTYEPMTFTDGDKTSILLMGGDDKLHYAGAGAKLGAQRAYFKITDPAAAHQFSAINIEFGDETTGLTEWKDGKMEEWESFDSWYTLNGHKLLGKPTQKGIYINNGRKVVMK